jgi:hypothetical protein
MVDTSLNRHLFSHKRDLQSIKDKHTYPINYSRPGLLVLFNYQNFIDKKHYRAGSEKDVENVTRLFKHFNYEIKQHLDKSAADTLEIISEYARRDYSNDTCVIFFIMSHGNEKGKILASNQEWINVNDFVQPFKFVKSLTRKPKLFFIQACRGEDKMRFIGDVFANEEKFEHDGPNLDKDDDANVPIEADFLFCYSTVEGYYSLR